jgi:hypothetical protein
VGEVEMDAELGIPMDWKADRLKHRETSSSNKAGVGFGGPNQQGANTSSNTTSNAPSTTSGVSRANSRDSKDGGYGSSGGPRDDIDEVRIEIEIESTVISKPCCICMLYVLAA